MKFAFNVPSALPLLAVLAVCAPDAVKAETQACTHGSALLQNDAQAWLTLQSQLARLKGNVTKIRTEISDVIDINDDVGKANKTASDIHKNLSLIAPLFELAPSLQSGLDKTAHAAEIAHKKVLSPIYKVTNTIVTDAKLHEIRAEIDTKVLPKISAYEKDSSTAHLKSVTLGKDFIEACHIAATIKSAACISAGNKAIDAVYATFNKPVHLLDTAVLDTAKGIAVANRIMETEISVGLNPVLDIHAPVVDISKVVEALEREIRKLEDAMKQDIHIRIHPFDWKFTIEHLLKEWKAELKKLEHLVNVDKLKKEMREAVEKVIGPIVRDIEKFIHSLEHSFEPRGLDLSALEAAFRALEKELAFTGPHIDLSALEKAIKEIEDALRALEKCK